MYTQEGGGMIAENTLPLHPARHPQIHLPIQNIEINRQGRTGIVVEVEVQEGIRIENALIMNNLLGMAGGGKVMIRNGHGSKGMLMILIIMPNTINIKTAVRAAWLREKVE